MGRVKDSKAIEDMAINAVRSYFERSMVVAPYVSDNDKEPLWDGHLYIHSEGVGGRSKSNFLGRIPVQIKGKAVKEIKYRNFKFDVSVMALKNYRRDGGMIFFVVQISDERKTIFYRELTPSDIVPILKRHGDQKTIKLVFEHFPDSLKEGEKLLVDFLSNLKKQSVAITFDPLTFEKVRELKSTGFTFTTSKRTHNIIQLLVEKPRYLYAKFEGMPDLPIEGGRCSMKVLQNADLSVKVGDFEKVYTVKSTFSAEKLQIEVGHALVLEMMTNTCVTKISLTLLSQGRMLNEVVDDLCLLLSIKDNTVIQIGSIPFEYGNLSDDFSQLEDAYQNFYSAYIALQKLGCNDELLLSTLSNDDSKWLEFFAELMSPDSTIPWDEELKGLRRVKIGNLKLLVYFYKVGSYIRCIPFPNPDLDIEVKYNYQEGTLKESIFGVFTPQEFCDYVNMPYEMILKSYENIKDENPYVISNLNDVGLKLIHAYDMLAKNSKRRLLIEQTVVKIFECLSSWIVDKKQKITFFINRCQMLKRQGTLSYDDLKILHSIVDDKSLSPSIRWGAAILEDNDMSKYKLWEQIPSSEKEFLKTLPIWNLSFSSTNLN